MLGIGEPGMNEQEPVAETPDEKLRRLVLGEVLQFRAPQRGTGVTDLAARTGASHRDIRQALAALEQEGLISGRIVHGTRRYVRSSRLGP